MALILILIQLLVKKSCFEPLEAHYAGEIAQLRAEVAGDDGEPEIKDEEDGEGDQRAGARFAVDGKIFDIHEHTFPVETK